MPTRDSPPGRPQLTIAKAASEEAVDIIARDSEAPVHPGFANRQIRVQRAPAQAPPIPNRDGDFGTTPPKTPGGRVQWVML
ncbi:MAG: hypothetical protein GXP05_06560 [Alphaproteobacteria bacterium]|nr:hypothetical protein [Alphaproteobacteria bacterium]